MTDAEKYAMAKLEKAQKMAELLRKQRELKELNALIRDVKTYNKTKQQ